MTPSESQSPAGNVPASTEDLQGLPTPPEVTAALGKYRDEIKRAAGDALLCLALYGGLVRGRYQAQQSDINLLLVMKDAGPLDRLAPILRAAWREIRLEPFLLTEPEVQRAAVVFPTKLLDIQREHRLLAGRDVLNELVIHEEELCRRIEQELRNLAMRLRRRYLSIYDDDQAMQRALLEAAVPLRVNFLALLGLAKVKIAEEERTGAVFAAAAERFKLDGDALQRLSELRNTGASLGDVRQLYGAVMNLVAQTADLVKRMASGE
jgi:hypothetical protein